MLLVAGGDADPNIICLVRRLANNCYPHLAFCVGCNRAPRVIWDVSNDRLQVNGLEVNPTAVFLRYDVFTHLRDRRPESQRRASRWYYTIFSWVLAHDHVAFLNRKYVSKHATKAYVLYLAKNLGLEIPGSLVTNDLHVLDHLESDRWIVKPINGGEYTQTLAGALNVENWLHQFSEAPAIVQRRLVAPDLRIYRVRENWFAFTLHSDGIDYRISKTVDINPVGVPEYLIRRLAKLMDHLGLDFGAADFKSCPDTGRYLFLEVNSAPMFTAFDRIIAGALVNAIVNCLVSQPFRGEN